MFIASALAASLALSPPIASDWRTLAERSGYTQTPRYAETLEYFSKLDAASANGQLVEFGTSPQGRKQFAFVIASGGEFTPISAQASGKPVLLIQACIHAGENEGKDALMTLSREWLLEAKQKAALDGVILLLIPIFNVDGHERFSAFSRINQNGPNEMGWRSTAQNYNLNRDFVKAESPEMRAWLKLWQAWNPSLLVDMHNTDGSDYQYQLTYHFETSSAVHPAIAAWQEQTWNKEVVPRTEKFGTEKRSFILGPYVDLKVADDIKAGIVNNYSAPRYSAGFGVVVNRPSLLLETHMMKDFKTRVQVNQAFVRELVASIGGNPKTLVDAVTLADRDSVENAVGSELALSFNVTDKPVDFAFKGFAYDKTRSDVSGGLWTRYDQSKPETWTIPYFNQLEPTLKVTLPAAYLIPGQWRSAIRLLRRHGVEIQTISAAQTLKAASTYRFSDVLYAPQPFEGRVRVASLAARAVNEDLAFPAGSVLVRMNQARAHLIANLLEPLAPDSLIRIGLGDGFMTRAEYAEPRVLEAKAREMLARDAKLQAEFDAKLADPEFAASANARLNFFYERTGYYDQNYLRYPVARLSAGELAAIAGDDK
jgi:hypothetical protein